MRRTYLSALFLATAGIACSGETIPATGLVLGLQLDLAVPEDTDHVAVYVALLKDGRRIVQPPAELRDVSRGEVSFVASLTLESHDPSDRVQVRFVAFDANEKVIAMREARAQVPQTGTRLLRLPLLWINEGKVQDNHSTTTPAQTGLDFRDLALQTTTEDAFSRFSDGCPPEQTLGNDGACRTIEVRDDELIDLEGGATPPERSCMDLPMCFHGGAVRDLELAPVRLPDGRCEVDIPATVGTQKPALVMTGATLGGFPLGTESDAVKARPIDGALYDYDAARSVLRFVPALCEKIERLQIRSAKVSAKCDPKHTDDPICGANKQRSGAPHPANSGVFVDASGPDDGGSDAGLDADADPPLRPSIHGRTTADFTSVASFAARGAGGNLWIEGVRGTSDLRVYVTPFLAATQLVDVPAFDDTYDVGQLSVDRHGSAYLTVANANPPGAVFHYGLGTGTPDAARPILVCPVGVCASGATTSCNPVAGAFAVGDRDDEVVGLTTFSVNFGAETRTFVSTVVKRGEPHCFEPHSSSNDGGTLDFSGSTPRLSAAITMDEHELVAGLRLRTAPSTTVTQLLRATDARLAGTSGADAFELIANYGPGRALTVTRDPAAGILFRTLGFGAEVTEGPAHPSSFGNVSEMFGGPNVACMRAHPDGNPDQPAQVLCELFVNGAHQEIPLPLDSDDAGATLSPHVYADETYLYVGQLCADRSFSVRGVPFERLQTVAGVEQEFKGICKSDTDGGAR